jgi:hypothetical protein
MPESEGPGAPILLWCAEAEAVGVGVGFFAAVARAKRYQMSQAGVVQRKRVEVTLDETDFDVGGEDEESKNREQLARAGAIGAIEQRGYGQALVVEP